MTDYKKIKEKREEWENNRLKEVLERYPERKEEFETSSGEPLKRVYSPPDLENHDYLEDEGFPGSYPFTRGVQPTMYRGKLWTMRQYAGFGTAEETNERFRYLLDQGQTGLSVAFDLPTQLGYDSDHPLAAGEVGKVGVSVDSLADMEVLFQNIPLEEVSTSMTINSTAPVLLGAYIALARKRGIDEAKLRGTVQNDILKEYTARGTYIYPPEPSLKLTTDIFSYCTENVPGWNTISISGYHIREAGATAAQEIAFTLANAIEYVKSAVNAGLEVDEFAPRLSFFFNAHSRFLEEVAKFRAARKLWADIMKNRFGAEKQKSQMMRFHTQTAGSTLTAQQPDNNVVRVCLQALAAVLGGTQSLHTNSRDEALSLPTEDSVRLALRTQQIIAHETDTAETVDPLGGSYAVESLTDSLCERAKDYIEQIDGIGGAKEAIREGFIQSEIQDSAYRQQREIERGERKVVGVNVFKDEEDSPEMELHKVDAEVESRQKEKLKDLKSRRDSSKVDEALTELRKRALEGENTMPAIIDACSCYGTVQEIADVLRECYGEFSAPE